MIRPPGALQLTAHMFEMVQAIEQFAGLATNLRLPISEQAVKIALELRRRTPSPEAERLAYAMCTLLHPKGHPPAAFWATALGADIAWHIGYPHEQVPVWAAAAVLRVNRVTAWRLAKQQGPLNAVRLRELTRSRNPLNL